MTSRKTHVPTLEALEKTLMFLECHLPDEVATIRRIFHEFVELGYSEYRIAEGLNGDGICFRRKASKG